MHEYTLHDGRVLTIDPYALTHAEFVQITTADSGGDDEAVIAKAAGLSLDEVAALPERDWRGLIVAVVKATVAPDPH